MNIILGILAITFGILGYLNPEGALKWEDKFRIRGRREYSGFAIGMMKFRGIIGVIVGIALFFVDFM